MSGVFIIACVILLFVFIHLIYSLIVLKQIKTLKKETETMQEKIAENKKHCGYVKTDLPSQVINIKSIVGEALEVILKSVNTVSKLNNENSEKALNEIKKQISDTLEMLGDIYSFQPKMISDINENYNEFVEKITHLFLELKNHVLSKQEISKGEYLIFVKLIFDIVILKSTKINFNFIDEEIICNFNIKNTHYKSKITEDINSLLLSLESVKYIDSIQKETKRCILELKDELISSLYVKMNDFMVQKSLKNINEFNKTEIKSYLSNTIIEICESKKIEVIDLIRG